MTIIEAAAKAHWESDATNDRDPYYDEWTNLPDEYRELLCNLMRAALRAMAERAPSLKVHEAIRNAISKTEFSSHPLEMSQAVWAALLLAAAEEE